MIHALVLAVVTTVTPAPTSSPVVAVQTTVTAPACNANVTRSARWLKIGAQVVNTLVVANATRHGSSVRMLGGGSPLALATQFAAIDFTTDQLDRRASCTVRAAIDAFFAAAAFSNSAKTEFPK